MKKLFRKTTAAAVSALLLAQFMPVAEMSATSPDKNKLTIHPYVLDQTNYDKAKTANKKNDGSVLDSTALDAYGTEANISFDITQVNEDGTPIASGKTGRGVKELDEMPDGYYLIDPLDGSTDSAFGASDAFIIQLPVPKAGGGVNRDVHIYPKLLNNEEGNNNTPGSDDVPNDPASDTHYVELTKYDSKAKNAQGNLNTTLSGAKFNVYYKDAAGNMVPAASGDNKKDYTTDSTGKFTITGLPLGDYYFVEKTAPTGYLLDQTPAKFTIDGTSHAVINFPNDKKLTVSSETAGDATGDQSYNWTITADVPENTDNLISYVITGSYTNLDSSTISASISGLQANQYTVDVNQDGTFTITINDMSALAGLDTLEIKVESQIESGQTSATTRASIEYKYAYTPKNTDPDISDIPVPGVNYPTAETHSQAAPASLTLATFNIKNVSSTDNTTELGDGEYKITIGDNTTVTLTDDGSTKLASIVNYAPGKYKVEQNKTESGYLINDTARTIFITADGKMYEDTNGSGTLETTGQSPDTDISSSGLVFINQKTNDNFALPFTGTTATRVFTVTGICVMLAAGGFIFMVLRKKDEDEEDNKG